jgi:hypothetical protein
MDEDTRHLAQPATARRAISSAHSRRKKLATLLLTVACSHRDNVSYKDGVKKGLEQAELKDVTVSEDQDKNTITLGGTVHSDEAIHSVLAKLIEKTTCRSDSPTRAFPLMSRVAKDWRFRNADIAFTERSIL